MHGGWLAGGEGDEAVGEGATPGEVVVAAVEFGVGEGVVFGAQGVAQVAIGGKLGGAVAGGGVGFEEADIEVEADGETGRGDVLAGEPLVGGVAFGAPPVGARLGEDGAEGVGAMQGGEGGGEATGALTGDDDADGVGGDGAVGAKLW